MTRLGRLLWAALALSLALAQTAGAEGTWLSLTGGEETPPEAFAVSAYTGDITLTFLGDCTLGGVPERRNHPRGFVQTVAREGYAYPLRGLLPLTGGDDVTLANLEGVLSDRKLDRVRKKYNFIGPSAFTEILREGSVECVTLANNHTEDFGPQGLKDTEAALDAAGVAWCGGDAAAVWRHDSGLMIGFLGVHYSLQGERLARYARQAEALRKLECAAVITVMHAGEEYSTAPTGYQKQIAGKAAEAGSCLVVGHHPHVVQGLAFEGGIPVVYSLGNCAFGGTLSPRDADALALQAVLHFEEGTLTGMDLHFHPVSVTRTPGINDYAPCLLTGADAGRVLEKMEQSTGVFPGTWEEGEGASVHVDIAP